MTADATVDDTPPPAPTRRGRRWLRLWTVGVPVVAIALGSAVRLRQAISHRSLWLDEASIAVNVVHRSLSQLGKTLWFGQSAPILWLWTERGLSRISVTEGWLRLPETVAGIGVLVATWLLARQVLPRSLTPLPVVAVATCSQLIYYSNELKPYGSDALCVVVLLLLAVRALPSTRPRLRVRDSLPLAVAAGLTAVYSDQALLTGVGLLVYLLALRVRYRDWRGCAHLIAAGALDAAVLVPYDLDVLRPTSHTRILRMFWYRGFPPSPRTPSTTLHWLGHDVVALAGDPLGYYHARATVFLVLLACGVLALALRAPGTAGVLGVPVVMAVAAAIAGDLPLSSRIALGLVPPLVIFACGSPALLWRAAVAVRGRWRGAVRAAATGVVAAVSVLTLVALAVITGPQLVYASRVTDHPITREETGPLVSYLSGHLRADQLVAVDAFATSAWLYYAPRYHLSAQLTMTFPPHRRCSELTEELRVRTVDPHRRPIWILTGHRIDRRVRDEYGVIARRLTPLGRLGWAAEPGARLFLFTPRRFTHLPRRWRRLPTEACLDFVPRPPVLPTGLAPG